MIKPFNNFLKRIYFVVSIYVVTPVLCYAAIPNFIDATGNISGTNTNQKNGGGIAWIDYDRDGWQDLYIANATGANRLYKNLGDSDLNGIHDGFVQIFNANIEMPAARTNGVIVADYNNDGFDDIFLSNSGVNSLLENRGDGTFFDVAAARGLSVENEPNYAATFGDVDKDGDLDLYVVAWPGTNYFYRNRGGNLGFDLVTNNGIVAGQVTFDAVMTDIDNDGDLDIYEANDFLEGNKLFINNGTGQFTLNVGGGSNVENTGMGIAIGDYNRTGLLDIYATSISMPLSTNPSSTNALLKNNGANTFSAVSQSHAVLGNERLVGTDGCSPYWGASFLDVDNDGNLDIYAANDNRGFGTCGSATSQPLVNQNRLYINKGAVGGFTFAEKILASVNIDPGLGVATADFDKDGRIDIAVYGKLGDVKLLRNVSTTSGNGWLELDLISNGTSNMSAIGAKVRITSTSSTGTITQVREVRAGGGHGSTDAHTLHFGFPAGSSINNIRIEWPSGIIDNHGGLEFPSLNRIISLVENDAFDTSGDVTFSPNKGAIKSLVGIKGRRLCQGDCSQTRVWINGKMAIPTFATNRNILFEIPVGAITGRIVITGTTGTLISTRVFRVIGTIAFEPKEGIDNSFVTLIGAFLCQGDCSQTQISINGSATIPIYATNGKMIFAVPPGATTGPIVVTGTTGTLTSDQNFTALGPVPRPIVKSYGFANDSGSVVGENLCFEDCGWETSDTILVVNGLSLSRNEIIIYLVSPELVLFTVSDPSLAILFTDAQLKIETSFGLSNGVNP